MLNNACSTNVIIHPFSIPLLLCRIVGGLEHPAEPNINKHIPTGNLEYSIHLACMTELREDTGAPRGNAREHKEHANCTQKGPSRPWLCSDPMHFCCEANH